MVPRSLGQLNYSDPRYYQIGVLSFLLGYGLIVLDLEITFFLCISFVLGTVLWQAIFTFGLEKIKKISLRWDFKSALISSLSLCLLVRTQSPLWVFLIPLITIASKFLIRIHGKHVYNPTNLAIVMMLIGGGGWVSPGQWGSPAFLAFLMACLGMLVVFKSTRADVALSFLFFWSLFIFSRSLVIGEPLTIPLHRLQTGSTLLFSFFMISDPKTTPDSKWGRILFSFLVAAGAYYIHFVLYRNNGFMWSLAFVSTFVPVIDLIFRGEKYVWSSERVC